MDLCWLTGGRLLRVISPSKFREIAAQFKVSHGLHYADCFASAITGRENVLVAADVKDFKRIPWLQLVTLP